MLDPGSSGGGQISNLISDDGKSPKGLLCHLHCVDIFCVSVCVCVCVPSSIEMLSGAKLNFFSCHPPPPPHPSLPSPIPPSYFFSSLSLSSTLHPMWGMQDHVCSFLFNQSFLFLGLSAFHFACSLAVLTSFLSLSLSLPACSDLFSFVRQGTFWTLSQLTAARVPVRKLCAFERQGFGWECRGGCKNVSSWEQTVPNCC